MMTRLEKLLKRLDIAPDDPRKEIITKFVKKAFKAGSDYRFNSELSLIDGMKNDKLNFNDWISKSKKIKK